LAVTENIRNKKCSIQVKFSTCRGFNDMIL